MDNLAGAVGVEADTAPEFLTLPEFFRAEDGAERFVHNEKERDEAVEVNEEMDVED
ncbi:MAG: hypothetical protein M1829_002594, partial [Trizodia sp. TS-e1964]